MKPTKIVASVILCISLGVVAEAQTISVSGSYKGAGPGWDRGMNSTMHCGNNPESWARGSASLDKSGRLSITVQLETDSTTAGPKGRVSVTMKDAVGRGLATATTDEIGIGGKPPGGAVIKNFSSTADIDQNIVTKTKSMYIDAQCTGSVGQLWGIDLGDAAKAFKIIVTALQ